MYKRQLKGSPDSATYHYHLGMAYQKAGNFALSKKEFEATLQINPNFSEAAEIKKVLAQSQRN